MSRPIGALLKEHAVLVAGIALPAMLILVFMFAKAIPGKTVEDPQYKAVVASLQYQNGYNFEFDVKGESLQVTYNVPKEPYRGGNKRDNKIYIYDASTDSTQTITLVIPEIPKGAVKVTVPVKEFKDLKVIDGEKSPDGYEYNRYSRNNSSLITEVFTYNNHRTPNTISKDGRIISITPLEKRDYSNVVFLGWVAR